MSMGVSERLTPFKPPEKNDQEIDLDIPTLMAMTDQLILSEYDKEVVRYGIKNRAPEVVQSITRQEEHRRDKISGDDREIANANILVLEHMREQLDLKKKPNQ